MSAFMAQVLELLQNLNKKVDNNTTRLLLLEKKIRELKKEIHLMRMENRDIKEEEKDDEEE